MRTNTPSTGDALAADVSFTSRGATLRGTLARPDTAGPHPIAVLLPGSGPLDRDGNVKTMRLNIQAELAATLAREGWASLRYDKAGVGESEGDYLSTGLEDELADARAAVAHAAGLAAGRPVIVIGHSAGSIHAASLAASEPAIAGAVLLSGLAQDGESVLRWQTERVAATSIPAFAKALLRLFRTSPQQQQAKAIERLKATTRDVERIQLQKVNAKWMREMLAHNPLPDIASSRVPVLAITGTKDLQVDHHDLELMRRAADDRVTTVAAASVDHLLRDEPEPQSRLQRYRKQAKKPLSASVTEPLVRWLQEVAR